MRAEAGRRRRVGLGYHGRPGSGCSEDRRCRRLAGWYPPDFRRRAPHLTKYRTEVRSSQARSQARRQHRCLLSVPGHAKARSPPGLPWRRAQPDSPGYFYAGRRDRRPAPARMARHPSRRVPHPCGAPASARIGWTPPPAPRPGPDRSGPVEHRAAPDRHQTGPVEHRAAPDRTGGTSGRLPLHHAGHTGHGGPCRPLVSDRGNRPPGRVRSGAGGR
jgi:hypothetical protein